MKTRLNPDALRLITVMLVAGVLSLAFYFYGEFFVDVYKNCENAFASSIQNFENTVARR
jgi:hypothetical protein